MRIQIYFGLVLCETKFYKDFSFLNLTIKGLLGRKFSSKTPHWYLNYVLVPIPLGDEEQLGQTFMETVTDFCAELPQELFLVLEKLCGVFVVHDFFEFQVLQKSKTYFQ